jgi:hypothetical protein
MTTVKEGKDKANSDVHNMEQKQVQIVGQA